jgi:hypothetical protein
MKPAKGSRGTSLARLQAGREERRIEPLDVTPIMQQLCEGIRP